MVMTAVSKSFHNVADYGARAYQTSIVGGWRAGYYVTLRNRSLTYQFFPHFQPYVLPLVQRLNEGGLSSLQDADTVYLPQPNSGQPLTVLPDSTRGVLAANVSVVRNGSAVTLSAGTPLTLPNGTAVSISAGTAVAHTDGSTFKLAAAATVNLPGALPIQFSSGIQWTIAGVDTIVPDSTTVTLPTGAASAVLTNDGSVVSLPNATHVSVRGGLPQPLYYEGIFDASHYNPTSTVVQHPYPVKNLDFTYNGAYSIYNWELFFHAPLLIAIHLSQNQKYQDAQNWFHYIFNPADNSLGPTPERFWKVAPFQYTDVTMMEQILVNLSTNQDPALFAATVSSIESWKENPFQPFAVAKYRPTSYMLKTVMAYLDNLIAWGDSLFAQYTIETINEATQLYVMAANVLGSKPQPVPKKGSVKPFTYNDLRGKLDDFGNALVNMEVDIPFDTAPLPGPASPPQGSKILAGIGQTLYFCVPRNDKLLSYWDTVADRLFKIHNSLNLQGVFQTLPLFDPPIDPALLVRAAAAGLDISAVVGGLNQPLPLVKFEALTSKATEICQEVKSLETNLLSAIEKQDAESIALMRAQHESALLGLAEMVKYSQWQDAIKAREGLQQSLANSIERFSYYQTLLGRSPSDIQNALPQLDALDTGELENLKFQSNEPQMPFSPVDPDISADATAVSDGELKTLSRHEVEEMNKLDSAHIAQITAGALEQVGSVLALIPQFKGHVQPMGCGATIDFGGQHLHAMMSGLATISRITGEQLSYEASKTGKIGSYARRELDWIFQSNAAAGEINQVFKQLRGAQIREAIAQKEYTNHQAQMKQSQEIINFLQGNSVSGFQLKQTTAGFYSLMKRQVKALHRNAFQLAFEVARKAERALQHELGDDSLGFIQFNYLDGSDGLLAGEKLLLDLKSMEVAYQDLNQREFELTKQVSLLQVAPFALVELRAVGSCSFTLPEELFDFDGPGHYFRRITSVALTVPCVAGPYTSVNCTLTLQKSSIRISTDVAEGYARKGTDDPRFNDFYGAIQSIVTSSGQTDGGVFESGSDTRLRPFERVGIAGSQWQLSLPSDVRQFDFNTITDVILQVRYTARQGGDVMQAAAVQNLQTRINKAQTVGSTQLFSVRHEFPSDWAKFQSVTIGGATLTSGLSLTLLPEHYPFWSQGIVGTGTLKAVDFFAEYAPASAPPVVNLYDKPDKNTTHIDALSPNPLLGDLLVGKLAKISAPSAISDATHPPLTVYFDNNAMQQLWVAITWGK
jgi:hypothetical protein